MDYRVIGTIITEPDRELTDQELDTLLLAIRTIISDQADDLYGTVYIDIMEDK